MATMIDEYHGLGGSYVLDPETGERRPAERTIAECTLEPLTEEPSNGTPEPQAPSSDED